MKKGLLIVLAAVIAISGTLVACSSKSKDNNKTTNSTTTEAGLDSNNDDSYAVVTEIVTNKKGEVVTNKQGKPVTQVVTQGTTKKGEKARKFIQAVTDKKGIAVTDKNGKVVTKVVNEGDITKPTVSNYTTTTTKKATSAITGGEKTTFEETTKSNSKVPKTDESGKSVAFSAEDQQTVQNMLEVPYLYNANYENKDGVPINIAAHTAIWMAKREGLNTKKYASATIVLDLFNFYGQTVVNFKSSCNSKKDSGCGIKYNKSDDSFTIKKFEEKKQSIKITDIQTLGNNYYKVVATVSGAGSISKVNAIIQRNKLDSSLGFSLKALKWS